MKNLLLITLLIFLPISILFSQSRTKRWNSDFYGLEVQYCYFQPKIKELNSYLTSNYNSAIKTMSFVGLNFKEVGIVNKKFTYDWNIDFNYLIPTTYFSSLNSTSYALGGFQWGSMVHGHDLLYKVKRLDFIIGGGFNAGKYKLTQNNVNEKLEYKNKFFAPKITSEFRIIIKRFSIGIRAEYQWDTSKRNWTSNSSSYIPSTRFSGLNLQAFIGYGDFLKGSKYRR